MYSASPATTRIGAVGVLLGAERGVAAADDDVPAAAPELFGDLSLTRVLDGHAADADHVGRGVPVDRLDVLVEDRHVPRRRRQRRDGRQAQRGDRGPLVARDLAERPGEAPEALGQFRLDEQQLHVAARARWAMGEWAAGPAHSRSANPNDCQFTP